MEKTVIEMGHNSLLKIIYVAIEDKVDELSELAVTNVAIEFCELAMVNKAIVINRVNLFNEANMAIETADADYTSVTDGAEANEAIGAEEANKAANATENTKARANLANKANGAGLTNTSKLLLDDEISIDLFHYSLMKYSAIVAEVKEYFGIDGYKNQLAGMVWSCMRSLSIRPIDVFSLRTRDQIIFNKQLKVGG